MLSPSDDTTARAIKRKCAFCGRHPWRDHNSCQIRSKRTHRLCRIHHASICNHKLQEGCVEVLLCQLPQLSTCDAILHLKRVTATRCQGYADLCQLRLQWPLHCSTETWCPCDDDITLWRCAVACDVMWYDINIWCGVPDRNLMSLLWWYHIMTMCCDMWYDLMWRDMTMWCDMMWYGILMWCGVIWRCDVMWYDVIWHSDVMWRDMMWCDIMWYDILMWCDVIWCEMMWYDVMWCTVM